MPPASVGLIATMDEKGSCEADCILSIVVKELGSLSSVGEEVEEGVKGLSQAIVEGRLRNSEVLIDLASPD